MDSDKQYEQYYYSETYRYKMPYDVYIGAVDSLFVNHSDMKEYLIGREAYDAETDMVDIFAAGGVGDESVWETTKIIHYGDAYYVQGLLLTPWKSPDDEGLGTHYIESDDPERPTPMVIRDSLRLILKETDTGLKISAFYDLPFYAENYYIYLLEKRAGYSGMFNPLTVRYFLDGKEVEDNGVTISFPDKKADGSPVANPIHYFTPDTTVPWHHVDSDTEFRLQAKDGVTITNVTGDYIFLDDIVAGTRAKELGDGYYSLYGCEKLVINVYAMTDMITDGDDSEQTQIVYEEGLSKVPNGLKDTDYNTVEKIEDKLAETIAKNGGYSEKDTSLYDVELKITYDGGDTWETVTGDNFPKEGLTVTLPYPKGTNADDYDFVVAHMFEEDCNGFSAGDIETPVVTKTDKGISFKVMGLSPIMVGYKEIKKDNTTDVPETGDNSNLVLWFSLMGMSIFGIRTTYCLRKRCNVVKK